MRWLWAALVLVLGRGRRALRVPARRRIVADAPPSARAELVTLLCLGCATICAAGFVAVYALDRLPHQTQLLGLALGLSLAFLAAAAIVIGKALVPQEEVGEPYPVPEHPPAREEVVQIAEESATRLTRRRLLFVAGGGALSTLGVAALTPAASLGPVFDMDSLYATPWRRGVRLVDEGGNPLRADDIDPETFYTAYPKGADREQLGAPLVVVRLDPDALKLPAARRDWAPDGIVAYSKICTHAGCAVSLFRKPTFPLTQPRPALVCPCHYSTFDPADGGSVLFGPAGRPLPQLPLALDGDGALRSAGRFSGPVGPAWWGVKLR